jgi:predicted aspartyl protease
MRRMPYIAFICLFLALSPVVLLGADERAEQLLARHLAALGGADAIRSINSITSTAEIEILGTGLKGTIRSESLRPCLSYSKLSLGYFKIRKGYDGKRIWMVDPNGKLQFRRDDASLEYQKTACLIDSQEYLFGGAGFAVEAIGRDTVDGVSCDVLRIDVDGGASARLFLNDSTYLIERIEIRASDGTVIETYGDYRRVGGVMFPFFTRTELPAVGQRIEMRCRSVTQNETIDPIVFLPPAVDVKDYRFTGGGGVEEIPFDYRYRHLFVPVRITGQEGEVLFLLDSGASMTVVDSSISAEMRLPQGGVMPGAGAGGMTSFSMTRLPGLAIGGIEFSEQTAISFPLSGLLRKFEETEIGGILGYDFLSRFVTRIDFESEILSFFEPDSFVPPDGASTIEAPLVHNIFSLDASLDGVQGKFYLDTGANSSLLYGSFADSTGLVTAKRTLAMKIRGAGGEEEAALCRFDSLILGGFAIAKPVLAITRGEKGISVLENVDGVIGNDLLERFTVTLDYRQQRVLLEKNARFGEPFFRDRSGLQLARKDDGRFLVVAVVPDSPAERAHLRSGDTIVRVDGTKAERFKSLRELMVLFEARDGTTYTIEITRGGAGKKVTLTLAQYI